MDWTECANHKIVKEVGIDKPLINSLLASSERKLISQERLKLDGTTADSKVSLAYDALRELLEALAILKGYKIYNHECYCAFLKEILGEAQLGDKFDGLRIVRNSINYYGKVVSLAEAEQILKNTADLTRKIKSKFFQNEN